MQMNVNRTLSATQSLRMLDFFSASEARGRFRQLCRLVAGHKPKRRRRSALPAHCKDG